MARDVSVVGAGVAGLVLARELSSMGIGVTVYDGKRNVSDGAERASGILSKSGLERLGIDYRESVVNELRGATFHVKGRELPIMSDDTKAYVLDRAKLANVLARNAEKSGVNIEMERRLDISEIKGIAKSSAVLVGADGAVSMTASAFGFPAIKEYALTYKATYNNANVPKGDSVDIYLDGSITPGFFGWIAPHSRSELEVAVGIGSRYKTSSLRSFERFAETDQVRAITAGARMSMGAASLIPLHARGKTVKGNVLLVGDAAGHVKATTGGGIIFGVSCARIAAKAIEEHVNGGKRLLGYEIGWRASHGADLMLHRIAHKAYTVVGDSTIAAGFGMMEAVRANRVISRYGDMDSPIGMLKNMVLGSA